MTTRAGHAVWVTSRNNRNETVRRWRLWWAALRKESFRQRLMQSGVRRWRLWRATSLRRPFRPQMGNRPMTSGEIGELGERLTAVWMKKNGRRVLFRNYSGPWGGEVDIVCRHGKTLVFTEVKTRTRVGQYRPADAVNAEKRALIQRGATDWLRVLGLRRVPYRFDIVEVVLTEGEPPQINAIERAFTMPRPSWMSYASE